MKFWCWNLKCLIGNFRKTWLIGMYTSKIRGFHDPILASFIVIEDEQRFRITTHLTIERLQNIRRMRRDNHLLVLRNIASACARACCALGCIHISGSSTQRNKLGPGSVPALSCESESVLAEAFCCSAYTRIAANATARWSPEPF